MSDRQAIVDKDTKAKSSSSFWITMMVLLPVLYLLGTGPANSLANRYPQFERLIVIIYFPIIKFFEMESSQPFREPFQKYLELWE